MSQKDRVYRALQKAGAAGVCSVEFMAPHVIDGGLPITRLAARINELRDEGFQIVEAGRRHRCSVYRLVGAVAAPEPLAACEPEPEGLFSPVGLSVPVPHYRADAA